MNVFLIGYAAIGLLAWRPLAGHFAWRSARIYSQREPHTDDWIFGAMQGAIGAALWPLGVMWRAGSLLPKIGDERKGPRYIPHDPHYVRQLEKETGIDL